MRYGRYRYGYRYGFGYFYRAPVRRPRGRHRLHRDRLGDHSAMELDRWERPLILDQRPGRRFLDHRGRELTDGLPSQTA